MSHPLKKEVLNRQKRNILANPNYFVTKIFVCSQIRTLWAFEVLKSNVLSECKVRGNKKRYSETIG